MNPRLIGFFVALAATTGALAQQSPTDIDVTRVAIFSSGVAFFECDGSVVDNASVELKFRTDQINDILKSLVVQDYDGGSISVVSYASRDPVEKTLKSFAVDITGKPTFGQLLDQLRGEPVSIAGPRKMTGVIVGVESTTRVVDDQVIETQYVNVLTDDGMQALPIHELTGVELTNPKIAHELQAALATLAAGRDADKKTVVINFDGQGRRRVRAMYLLEAPIWKTSYRLVLSDEEEPYLQGWATVENATEEDWDNVQLSLVSGRPISFRMDLYTPLYVPRPVEELELYASLRPPTFAGAFEMEADANGDGLRDKSVPAAARRMPSRGRMAAKSPMVLLETPSAGDAMLGEGFIPAAGGVASVAAAEEAGELFQYVLTEPVTIARQHSAMLPIVTQDVTAEKVSIFNANTHPKHPMNGLMLDNSTGLSLMQGPITVFDGGIYAGDAKLPDLQPGEKRLLAYALDLPVEVATKQDYVENEVRLRIVKGTLYRQLKSVDRREYTIKNKDTDDRTVLIEQPQPAGWTLLEPAEPFEKTADTLRFKVAVTAGKSATQNVSLERVREESVSLGNVGLDHIRIYLRSRVISPALKEQMQRIIAMRTELDRIGAERNEAERKAQTAVEDQERIRRNLETLRGNTDQHTRQLRKFDEFEDQIEQWRARVDELARQEQEKRQALEDYLLGLNVE